MRVEADGKGLVGHAGIVLLHLAGDKTGLTAVLGRIFPALPAASWVDRASALVYLACSIALGARNLTDAERMACHHAPLGLSGGSDSTIWCLLDSIDNAASRRIARARAAARAVAWRLPAARESGFPWIEVAGKSLPGWIVIDMDATIIESASNKEGAAGMFKGTFGHHPRAAW